LQGIAAMLTPARAYPSFADTLAGEPETNTLL
jgi:hypothetical protein